MPLRHMNSSPPTRLHEVIADCNTLATDSTITRSPRHAAAAVVRRLEASRLAGDERAPVD